MTFLKYLSDMGSLIKRNGWPTTMLLIICLAGYHYFDRFITWAGPKADELITSIIRLHEKLDKSQTEIADTQEKILEVQSHQAANSERIIDLHQSMNNVLEMNSRKIDEVHRATVLKPPLVGQ